METFKPKKFLLQSVQLDTRTISQNVHIKKVKSCKLDIEQVRTKTLSMICDKAFQMRARF